ncbi:MAG TPA: FHA domain-containing protein [Gammaproteobacteria bacterium]|nr:FHA domain-containing protein [Gammaproteobacteria bacterium]
MTGQGKDKNNPGGSRDSEPDTGDRQKSLERLERALADETRTSTSLRDSLDTLRKRVEQMESSFEQRLGVATSRNQSAESRLAQQQTRLEALGQGREETMRALADARSELARVKVERDQLRQHLTRIEGMQTATVALPDDEPEEPGINEAPPSLEELMASLGSIEEAGSSAQIRGHFHLRVETPDVDESQEMIAPELVFPDELAEAASVEAPGGPKSRVLVRLDSAQPIKYPLYKDLMTIGRAESADIQIKGEFVSRVHARLLSSPAGVVVEDVSSKNGLRVNAEHTSRATLRHGDILGVGRIRFTFIDPTAADLD